MDSPIATQINTTINVLKSKVMLCFPFYNTVCPQTAFAIAQLSDKRRTASAMAFQDAFVAHTRNTLSDVFLETGLEWMLTLDSDVIPGFGNAEWFNKNTGFNFPEPFASFNIIDRLLSHGKTLVGALYFGRQKNGKPVFNEGAANKVAEADARNVPRDEIKPTKWVGTGGLLIHRSVFIDIEKKFPLLARGLNGRGGNWFTSSEAKAMDAIDRCLKVLTEGVLTGDSAYKVQGILSQAQSEARANSCLGQGEDVAFCQRAREAGHQPYVDYGCVMGHVGSHCYGPRG